MTNQDICSRCNKTVLKEGAPAGHHFYCHCWEEEERLVNEAIARADEVLARLKLKKANGR